MIHTRPTTRVRHSRGSSGFTLVEVMLAALIMGMMMVGMSQLMQAAKRTRDTIHNFQETQLAGPAVLEMMTRDLAGILTTGRPRTDWLQVTDRTVGGLDADRIDFVTTTDSLLVMTDDDDQPLRADFNEVGYVLRPNQENDEFLEIYRREDFGSDEEPFSGGEYTFLSDQVKGLNIEVYHMDGPDAEPEDEWTAESRAPLPGDLQGDGAGGIANTISDTDGLGGLPAWIRISLTIELKPRIDRESMDFSGSNKRTITYVRNVRFPNVLRVAEGSIPRLGLPPAPSQAGGTGDGGGTGIVPDGTDTEGGATDGGGTRPGGTQTGGGADGGGKPGGGNPGGTTVTVTQGQGG
ncbi:MAG: prepilin-type N-terminal cleavage/methylation domain-containing protein [Planctomycetota bacterium]